MLFFVYFISLTYIDQCLFVFKLRSRFKFRYFYGSGYSITEHCLFIVCSTLNQVFKGQYQAWYAFFYTPIKWLACYTKKHYPWGVDNGNNKRLRLVTLGSFFKRCIQWKNTLSQLMNIQHKKWWNICFFACSFHQ